VTKDCNQVWWAGRPYSLYDRHVHNLVLLVDRFESGDAATEPSCRRAPVPSLSVHKSDLVCDVSCRNCEGRLATGSFRCGFLNPSFHAVLSTLSAHPRRLPECRHTPVA
jgi:hypothetical protein